MTPKEIDEAEEAHWKRLRYKKMEAGYIARTKGRLTGLITQREQMWTFAKGLVGTIEEAHKEAYERLEIDRGQTLSLGKLSRYIYENRKLTYGRQTLSRLLTKNEDSLIDLVVMECRTLMTVRALSANFESEELHEVEERYVTIIADIIALWRRLRHLEPLKPDALRARAKLEAAGKAADQRRSKPVTMASREGFWRDREPPARKIFSLPD